MLVSFVVYRQAVTVYFNMERWNGKVAVVTGASAGIGAAIVVALVKQGLNVVGVARREERVKELESQIIGAPGKLFAKKGDVSKQEDIENVFDWVKETFGTVHILINNAGVVRYGRLIDQNPKYWREILDTNVLGLSICTQKALVLMKESGVDDGHIIHINSIMGQKVPTMSSPLTGMYAASKFAVTALTETLRQELRARDSNIRVTSISPGVVKTEIGDAANAAVEESERIDRTMLTGPRPELESEHIADAVVYVLSTPAIVQIHEMIIKPVKEPI